MLVPASVCTSYSDSLFLDIKGSAKFPAVFSFTSNCMDNRRPAQASFSRQRLQGRQSSPALQHDNQSSWETPQPYSSPLPQTQWTDLPMPYRPRNWPEAKEESYVPIQQHLLPDFHIRAPMVPADSDGSKASSTSKRRRRPRGLRNLLSRPQDEIHGDETHQQNVDVTLLYPQMSPYADRRSIYSAPDELEHYDARSFSQPNSPGHMNSAQRSGEPPQISIPRTPTYPPSGRRRNNSSHGVADAGFEDEEEFRLFAQATAGLGPEQVFRHAATFSASSSYQRGSPPDPVPLARAATTGNLVSPVQETPTTMYALQQLPQMPESHGSLHRERLQTSTSGLDLWLQNASATADVSDLSPTEDFDDELPDYAESQAQAQAHQRAEAARRAQELQRRWQLSGGRRGL